MDKIAVLIPCYNEERSIGKVIKDFKKYLPEAVIYVYDNNSTDNTVKIANSLGVIVRNELRQGKGNVVRTMFKEIDAQVYLMIDGDNTYPVELARVMCDSILNENYDMVIGDRLSGTYFKENKRIFHNFGNKFVRNLVNFLFKSKISDVLTGYRAFSYAFVKTCPVLTEYFEVETEMTVHAIDKKLKIKSVPVDYRDRVAGSESKLNTYKDGVKIVKTILNLYKNYKPGYFFTMISGLLLIIAIILFILFETSSFLKLCAYVMIFISILSFFCGLVLDNICKIEKREFECRFKNFSNNGKVKL